MPQLKQRKTFSRVNVRFVFTAATTAPMLPKLTFVISNDVKPVRSYRITPSHPPEHVISPPFPSHLQNAVAGRPSSFRG